MKDKERNPQLEVTFKRDPDEMALYYRIKTRCKLICFSGWCKEAMLEKLEREENVDLDNANYDVYINKQPNNEIRRKTEVNLPINSDSIDNLLNSFM